MFSDWSKNLIRSRIEINLTETCIITRWSETANSVYGTPERSVASQVEAKCFLTSTSRASDAMITDADKGRVFYMLQLPHDTDIEDGDTVTVKGEDYETKQVIRSQSVDVMRQALLVKAGS